MITDNCLNCGLCCHYIFDGKIKACKHLRYKTDGRSYCKVYKNRINRNIDKGVKCVLRKNSKYDYKGCPNNKGKPLLPIEK